MGENKPHSNREILRNFQSRLLTLRSETAYKYRNTISEIDLFVTGHRLQLSGLDLAMVCDFTVELLRRGLAMNTVIRHLNIFNSLVKWGASNGMMLPSTAPREMARILDESARFGTTCSTGLHVSASGRTKSVEAAKSTDACAEVSSLSVGGRLPMLMREAEFDGLLSGLRKELRGNGKHDVYSDVLLFSLLNGAMRLKEVVMLKKDEIGDYNEASRYVAERNRSSERKYVFDLKQSYQTPKQVYKTVEKELKERYGKFAIGGEKGATGNGKCATVADKFDGDMLVRSMWVAMAIKSGATASEALACQPDGASYALPMFCEKIYTASVTPVIGTKVSSAGGNKIPTHSGLGGIEYKAATESVNKSLWERSVMTMLTSDLPRWYAMHLRKGVNYDELRKEIAEGFHPAPELFYPSETIKKRIGSRTVIDDKPFITSTVFFKTYPEKILPMFTRIGDKAWCYRVTRGSGSPYAVISSSDMSRFQSVIGIFTPDIEIHPLGELTPKPGESVIVIKAGYNNRKGEVEEVINTEGGSAIFRIKLSTDQGYEWRVDLDPHQIERLLK